MKSVNIISTVVARGTDGKGAAGGNRIVIQGQTIDTQALKDEVLLEIAQKYLSKVYDDTAKGLINFVNGLKIANALLNRVIGLNSTDTVTDRSVMTGARIVYELEQLLKKADKRYIRKDQKDQTEFLVTFLDGIEVGLYVYEGTLGTKLHKDGTVEAGKLVANGDATFKGLAKSKDYAEGLSGWAARQDSDGKNVYETDKVLARVLGDVYDLLVRNHATFAGSLSSEEFVSGFGSGKGWAIRMREYVNAAGATETRSVAEFDDLIVRGTMRVTEFVVNQLLGENDNRVFTGMAEVEYYDAEADILYIQTRGGKLYNPFRVDDVIIVQQFGGMPSEATDYYVTKAYEFVVKEVGIGNVEDGEDRLDWLRFENFTSPMENASLSLIQKGDTLVRWDNLSDVNRKGVITINSVGEDTPYIDFLYGAKTDPDNALKGRLGNLGGIYHPLFGWLPDYGAYLSSLYAVGEFVIAHSGENVSDAIKIAQGAFRTNFRQSQYDLTEEANFLKNANFLNNCESWVLGADTTQFFVLDGQPLYFNAELLSTEESFAGIADYDGRDMLRLSSSTAMQQNANIRKPGTHREYTGVDADGQPQSAEVADQLYLNLRVYCKVAGTLDVGFATDGVYIDNAFRHTLTMEARVDAYTISLSGTWDGVGDFLLTSTGEVFVDLVSLTDKPLENYKVEMQTAIEQTAAGISLVAQRVTGLNAEVVTLRQDIDAVEGSITTMAQKVTAAETNISQLRVDVDGISSTVTSVKSTADQAKLVADAAKTAASNAVTAAESASTAAANASSKAADAQTAASNAQSAADKAQTTANSAASQATANATAIEQNKNSISILAGCFTQQDGKWVLTEAAGVVITDKVASLYATKTDVTNLSGRVTANATALSQLRVDVNGISATVTSVKGTAEDAADAAAAAEAAASAAATKATNAQTAASNAATAASNAQTTANNALNKANAAQTTANNAASAASTAQTTANNAQTTATNALNKATTNATAISQNKDSISMLAASFQEQDGKLVLTEAAGVVITNKVATLYATKTTTDALGNRITAAEAKIATSVQYNASTGKVTSNILLSADQIDLEGAVTFSMLASSVQSTINGKASASDVTTAVNGLKNSLGSLAYLSAVEKAQLGTTIISGGYIKAELLNVTEIYATKGTVGGFTIGEKSLVNTAADVSLSIGDLTGTKFVSLNDDNGVLYARNDGGTAIRAYTSGSAGIALSIIAQSSGKAISSTGNVNLTARPSGSELVTISGLALAYKSGTTFTGPSNTSIGNSSAWVDFLIANGNITLPTAASCPGKIIFIKFTGSYKVSCTSPIYKGNAHSLYSSSGGVYSDTFSARSLFFISNGSAWYEFLTYYRS